MKINRTVNLTHDDRKAIAAFFRTYCAEDYGEIANREICKRFAWIAMSNLLADAHAALLSERRLLAATTANQEE